MLIDEKFPGSIRTKEKYFTYNLVGCGDKTLRINGMGLRETMIPSFNDRIDGNRDFLILFFYDNINLQIKNKHYPDTMNRWIILKPGTPHSYGHLERSWCHSWIHLSGEFVENQLIKNKIPIDILRSSDISIHIETLLQTLHQEIYFNNKPINQIIKNHIETFILQTSRIETKKTDIVIPKPLVEIKQILDFRYREKWSLPILAEKAGFTVPYLCSSFKKYYNLSPINYLNHKRVDIAKAFLINTNLRVNEISYRVGFEDVYYFSKIFKKMVGYSPKQFRLANP